MNKILKKKPQINLGNLYYNVFFLLFIVFIFLADPLLRRFKHQGPRGDWGLSGELGVTRTQRNERVDARPRTSAAPKKADSTPPAPRDQVGQGPETIQNLR